MGLPYLNMDKMCCLKLPTVGIVIGVLGIICPIFKTLECFSRFARIRNYDKSETDETYDHYYDRLVTDVIYYELIPAVAYTLSSILVIVGIKKNLHLMLIPWLIINVIVLILLVPHALFFLVFAGFKGSIKQRVIVIAVLCLIITVYFWMWIVIFSLFEGMRVKKNHNQPLAANQKNLVTTAPRYEVVQYNNA